jgi:hypothetical protein
MILPILQALGCLDDALCQMISFQDNQFLGTANEPLTLCGHRRYCKGIKSIEAQ